MQTPGAQNCRKTADYFPFQVLYFVHTGGFPIDTTQEITKDSCEGTTILSGVGRLRKVF